MRVLLDANILISYLLTPDGASPPVRIVEAAVWPKFVLLLPEALVEEMVVRIGSKPYLADRIRSAELTQFLEILRSAAEIIPRITEDIPAVTRDPKDDYLLAYALVGRADYLVTGDADLLMFRRLGNTQIVTPRDFGRILETLGL
jgi:uncharacterized protein